MNFTSDIKKEIVNRGLVERGDRAEKSALSAFIRTSGALGFKEDIPTFFLVSETENVAEFFMSVFSDTFHTELSVTHATMDRKSGRDKLVLQCPLSLSAKVLKELGFLKRGGDGFREGISALLLKTEEAKIAYIQGAFLGGGSCIVPNDNGSGYHLEFVFSEQKTAREFCHLLAYFELIAKLVQRKETYVAYIKSKEMISDFLALIGAENSLKKFARLVEKRDEANRDNRAKNCISGNADKTAIAAVKQVIAIKKIEEKTKFKDLGEELYVLAKARLQNPTLSLKELATLLDTSKSCINHRMRRLMELSEEL